ncbi:MAG TPA: hypothetical protein VF107_12880 [Burkholderiaceae bacterium]
MKRTRLAPLLAVARLAAAAMLCLGGIAAAAWAADAVAAADSQTTHGRVR